MWLTSSVCVLTCKTTGVTEATKSKPNFLLPLWNLHIQQCVKDVLRDQKCANKPIIHSKSVFVFSHPAVHLWLNPSVVWTHALSSCCPVVLHRDASTQTYFCYQKRKKSFLFLSLSHSTRILKLFFTIFFSFSPECSFAPTGLVLEACLETNGRAPQGAASVITRCLGLQHGASLHVCTCVCLS